MTGLEMMNQFLDMAAQHPCAHELMTVLLANDMKPGDKAEDTIAATFFKSVSLGIALAAVRVGGVPGSTRLLAGALEEASRTLSQFHEGSSR